MIGGTIGSPTAGAVASSHYLATEAGADALRAGGNAIDAAIAAAAVLCVVYPNNVALGGDLVALVRDPSGGIRFVNATGRATRNRTLDELRREYGRALPDQGIDTITVPGGVAGWGALARSGSRLPWPKLIAASRRLAAHGAPVARSLASAIVAERAVLARDPGCAELFLPGGRALAEGDVLRQPALAATFDALIDGGPDAFYRGPLARRWVQGLARLGGRIDETEVASFRPTLDDPISAVTGGFEVVTSPPNTQGFSLLRTVSAVGEASGDLLGPDAARLADIFAGNNRVRSALLADPDFSHGHDLVTVEAPEGPENARAATGDTVGLVATSADGWSVSLVQSVYWAFGSAVLEPETGILFQNRGTSFSLDPGHPAAVGPRRRPPHTLMPVMVLRDGELAWTQATMGGQAQPQIHAHLLLRLLAGASAIEATSAPRWVVGAQEDGDSASTLTIETDVPSSARLALTGSAFDLKVVPPRNERLGHSNVVRVLSSGYDAASDPRSDGSAIVVS